jgi:small subunit ribosomal protein S1
LSDEKLEQQIQEMFGDGENQYLEQVLQRKVDSRLPGTILKGTIVSQIGNDVIVEVGLKSEGVVDAGEFDTPEEAAPGTEIEVLLEDTDSESGLILLSKRKADMIRGWEYIINTKKEGDVVKGRVIRRIKGGLLVDIGVPVFLPASQVDIRKPGDISRFIGKEVECKVLKIDVENRNIVVSRRKLIEEERKASKDKILNEIEVGQLRKGVVKNIADFGVFVDLGGLDGLLHISDLSWGRISHPSEVVSIDQEIECVVIGVDKENEKISLGLKQKQPSPWENVENKYPVGSRVGGKVVNVMNYGVFVRLEDGIEGLVHISEMSWTRRLSHPSEMVNLDDEIQVVVLNVNKEKQEISLGMKQTEPNPWELAARKYPPGTIVTANVRSMTNFGAFVEIEPGIDGMIHISDLSWTRKYGHPSEALQKGQEVKCVVLEVNEEKQRISLGMKQMSEDPWIHAIPEKYIPGQIIKGKIAKLTNFGAFVELESELEGLLHISELADHKIDKPQDVVKPGDEVEVKILKVDPEARKIGLSLRRVQWAAAPAPEDHGAPAAAPKKSPKQAPRPVAAGDAGGDTLRIKDALLKRAQAKAASGDSQEPSPEPPTQG